MQWLAGVVARDRADNLECQMKGAGNRFMMGVETVCAELPAV
jgi:hypothetical protein